MKDTLTRTDSRLATLGSVFANWRDWNLPVKLAAVTLVPVVFAIVLGAMQIADQVDRAGSYRQVDRLVLANEELRALVTALQRERTGSAMLLAERSTDIETELSDERGAVDGAREEFSRAAERVRFEEEVTSSRYRDVRAWLGELRGVREQVSGSLIDASTVLGRYTGIIEALLRFDRALAAEMIDPTLVSTSAAQHELETVGEQVQFQHALIGMGIVRGGLVGPDLEGLRASLARFEDSVGSFRAVADAEYTRIFDRVITEQVTAGRTNLAGAVAASQPGARIPTTVVDWYASSDAAQSGIARVADTLGRQVRDRSAALQDEASDGAGLAAVILLVALVVAIAVMVIVGRHLVSSLSVLRRSALEVAEQRLPAAVAKIRDHGAEGASITLEPVPVTSMDEVGQVARAFEAVQLQALRLATEQAGLRAQYSSVFVNLSRRSQGLVQRQLHLLERLERDEEDADQLATLFQLDHLATRMRRNNENLMVLSGSDVGRRSQRPATLADLLRASVSEIEQYQRVVTLPPPDVLVVGYAVGDLVRLIAELLDNATSFSAPDTNVTVASHSFEDGSVCVAVLDEGIGMNQEELDEANAKLADTASIDVSTSRRMGLFVIGRLAGRHGIEVRLNGGHEVTGVRATVTVPCDLVAASPDPARSASAAPVGVPSGGLVPFSPSVNGRGGAVNGTYAPANGAGSLPRRGSSVNGSDQVPGDQTPTVDLVGLSGGEPAGGAEDNRWGATDRGSGGGSADGRSTTGEGRTAGGPGGPGGPDAGPRATGAGRRAAADRATGLAGTRGDRASGFAGGRRAADDDRAATDDGPRPVDDWASGWGAGRGLSAEPAAGAGDDRATGEGRDRASGRRATADGASEAGDDPSATDRADGPDPTGDGRWGAVDRSAGPLGGGNRPTADRSGAVDSVTGRAVSDRSAGSTDHRQLASGRSGAVDSVTGRGVSERSDGPLGTGGRQPASGRSGAVDAAGSGGRRSASGRSGPMDSATGRAATDRSPGPTGSGGRRPVSDRPGATDPTTGRAAADRSAASRRPAPGRTAGNAGDGPRPTPGTSGTELTGTPARTPLPRRSPGGGRTRTRLDATRPFTPAGGLVSPADGLFSAPVSSPGRPGPGESPPPAGVPRAPRPHPRRTSAGGTPLLVPNSLFTPWWPPGPPAAPRALDETTPIFDEMVSAWFRAASPPREPAPPAKPAPQPWKFEADAGFDAARAASRVEPADFTDTGLPRRSPRQNLVPGSVGTPATAAAPRHGKAAEDVRDRLSNYRHGVLRARDHTLTEWHFAADGGWRAANAVSTAKPVDFTPGGLPRRTPLDHLVPGSVPPITHDGRPRADRAEELRGRLGSFQQGLSRGRRSLADRSANGIRENKQQERE